MKGLGKLARVADFAGVLIAGGKAVAGAIRDRKKSPRERLAHEPRPIDAVLVAMLEERKRQRDAGIAEGDE